MLLRNDKTICNFIKGGGTEGYDDEEGGDDDDYTPVRIYNLIHYRFWKMRLTKKSNPFQSGASGGYYDEDDSEEESDDSTDSDDSSESQESEEEEKPEEEKVVE